MDELKSLLRNALESLERSRVETLILQATRQHSPMEIIEGLIMPVLKEVGEDWAEGKVALSQVYMSGRICEDLVGRLLPELPQPGIKLPHCAIVVLSDYHMLGKRIVLSVMRASGYEVLDYGRMEVGELVERVVADEVAILLISVLMLPAALKVKEVRQALDARGVRTRIAVGGAPFLFDSELWREVGADAMGRSAAEAEMIVRRWAKEMA